jgi:hypothetical protein
LNLSCLSCAASCLSCAVDKGIQTGPDSKYFALYSEMKKSYTNYGKELVLQVKGNVGSDTTASFPLLVDGLKRGTSLSLYYNGCCVRYMLQLSSVCPVYPCCSPPANRCTGPCAILTSSCLWWFRGALGCCASECLQCHRQSLMFTSSRFFFVLPPCLLAVPSEA